METGVNYPKMTQVAAFYIQNLPCLFTGILLFPTKKLSQLVEAKSTPHHKNRLYCHTQKVKPPPPPRPPSPTIFLWRNTQWISTLINPSRSLCVWVYTGTLLIAWNGEFISYIIFVANLMFILSVVWTGECTRTKRLSSNDRWWGYSAGNVAS